MLGKGLPVLHQVEENHHFIRKQRVDACIMTWYPLTNTYRDGIVEVLKNWHETSIEVIFFNDGEQTFCHEDLDIQGMGIPVGKFTLNCALEVVSAFLPIPIDFGTYNENLLNDELCMVLKQKQATDMEFLSFFMNSCLLLSKTLKEKVLLQFVDFANHNAFDSLVKDGGSLSAVTQYKNSHEEVQKGYKQYLVDQQHSEFTKVG